MEFEIITKIEAAEQQLKEAIRLFFERRNKLAIHTLAGAAHEILANLGKKQGIMSSIKGFSLGKPDKRLISEYIKRVNHPKNFLKHASRDPEEVLKFEEKLNEHWLFDATHLFLRITGNLPHQMLVFNAWFISKYPMYFFEPMKQILEKFHKYKDFEDYDFWLNLLDNKK